MKALWYTILVLFILMLVNGAFTPDRDHVPTTTTYDRCAVHC